MRLGDGDQRRGGCGRALVLQDAVTHISGITAKAGERESNWRKGWHGVAIKEGQRKQVAIVRRYAWWRRRRRRPSRLAPPSAITDSDAGSGTAVTPDRPAGEAALAAPPA